ncbi:laminin subunit alpha-1-like [Plakobranchus ocellatus]|uniref:Laminin subunit alpha-1-like n=1 Tax=Plakobranchus ocellatus TaxID=259542 RepID=A0AAV4DCN9_9GAST|nr:laminin subunit alpha-1-like [Plakobranchus ocellatus]
MGTTRAFVVLITLATLYPSLTFGQTVNVALQKPVTAMYSCGIFGPETYNTLTDAFSYTRNSRVRRICRDARVPGPDRPDLTAQITLSFTQVPTALKEWSRVRYLRVSFYDMLFIAPFNALANAYNHYAVSELTVMAECPCNALQTDCVVSPETGMYECVCGGNSRGRYCEMCLPLFNQYKFEFGRSCTECNCFNHATSCFYEEAVELAGESIDINGQKAGGGVCIDCKHNTDGNNCEKCVAMYFRPANILQTSEDACVPCNCNSAGSKQNPETNLVDCVMNNDVARSDGKLPGDCFCKANVQGSKCGTCKPQFYNLQQINPDGCTACECYTPGTVGGSELCTPDAEGQCSCKANVQGRACNQCKDGFYGLSSDDDNGCTVCGCDVGGSVNQVCNKLSGQCLCRSNNIVGRTCNSVKGQYYYPSPHSIAVEFEDSFGELNWKRDEQYAGFSGDGYAILSSGDSISSLVTVPVGTKLSLNFTAIIRYSSSNGGSVNISVGGQANVFLEMTLTPCDQTWCMANSPVVDMIHFSPGPNLLSLTVITGQQLLLDKFVAFPVEYLDPSTVLTSPLPTGCDLLNNMRPSEPVALAACDAATFSLSMYYWSSPLPCNCDMTGSTSSSCEVNGGQCACRPGVVGRTCDRCSPDTYNFGPTGCAECSCDAFSTSCDQVTGQCECPDNTFGRQCQFCLPNHWDWHQTQGCKPCTCNEIGSSSLQCNLTTGVCSCKQGVQGDNCDTCQDEFHSLGAQGCLPCSCNLDGAEGNVCDTTTGQCLCKSNVDGVKCTDCKPGTFGLGTSAAMGCQNCVCMGITTQCGPGVTRLNAQMYPLSIRNESIAVPTLTLTNQDGTPSSQPVQVTTDLPTALTIESTAAQERFFWKMPEAFTSNLLKLYGTDLAFTVNFVVIEGSIFTTHQVFLLSGENNALSYFTGEILQGSDSVVTVTLRESGWVKQPDETPVTRAEFLKYLASANAVLIPASFATGRFTARLSSLSFSRESAVGSVNTAAENCVCGVGYTGGSCERCAPGYKRANVSSSDYLGVCVSCQCNGHSDTCDPDTGACLNCQHDTTGDSCEMCKVGYYGDATVGTSSDCTACPCLLPRVINATCHVNETDQTVVCDFCQQGYVGDLCDSCDNLYYGNPGTPGGTCSPCQCNGNADTCDSVTGLCNSCGFNTTGDNCEQCVTGFFGNASMQACQECGCVPETSTSTVCNAETGQCPCVSGVGGRTCSFCQLGFWGFESSEFLGCRECGCVEAGSTSVQCDNSTGICSCKPNTSGDLCDTCDDGFFGLPATPCEACGCDVTGTVPGDLCNKTSGQCQCQPGVGGRQCDQCQLFYVNFTSEGCSECGQCQKSLGADIETLKASASDVMSRAEVVRAVQGQDVRLQNLTVELNTSLVTLGLSNTEATSATEIVSNITATRDVLVAAYNTLQTQTNSLDSAATQLELNSQNEYTRQRQLSERATSLTRDCESFERTLDQYIQVATQYSNSASQYADAGTDSGTPSLNFDTELAQGQAVLNKVQDTTSMDATRATVTAQSQQLDDLNKTVTSQYEDLQGKATTLSDLMTSVNAIAASLAIADYDLDDGQQFEAQAKELAGAVETILTSTEQANAEAQTSLNAARAAVRNTNSILSGDARTIMTGEEFPPFPTGVANFETAVTSLRSRLTSLPVLIDVVEPQVIQAEAFLVELENTLNAVNRTYETIPQVATDAVLAIQNFEEVITDLGNSVTMAADANDLLSAIRTNVSGDAFDERRQEYEQEKTDAEALRTELAGLDYQTQVLQSSIQSEIARLNNEPSLWAQVDTVVDQMTTAANALNTKVQENTLDAQLNSASQLVQEAGTIARTVAESTANQDAVLTQKEEEVTRTEQAIANIQVLEQSVGERLTAQQTKIAGIQSNIDRANTLSQTAATTSSQIADKIRLLESKLANAETLLAQMRQPLNFDGSLGLTFNNPDGAQEHLYDEVSLEVRKPGTISDGVMFFVDDPNTADELQIGLKDDKIFFQYTTDTTPVVLESPADICANCWVRVDATRYGQVGHLTVTALSNGGSVSTSTPEPNTDTTSTISLPSSIYVGTIASEKQTNKVANRQFIGCLHSVEYQGQMLNLWTTAVATSPTATCCSHPPTLPDPSTIPGNSFNGLGYLILRPPTVQGQPVLMSQTRRIDIDFRTFSRTATIYLVQNSDATGYVSIALLEGSMVWEILTNGQLLRTQVQGQFNTGEWVQVNAVGSDTSLSLSVKPIASTDPPSVSEITFSQLDLTAFDNQNIILGAESNPLVEGYSPSDNNFAGCMNNFYVTTLTVPTTQISFTENVVASEGFSPNGCIEQLVAGIRFTSDSAFIQFTPVDQLQQLRCTRLHCFQVTSAEERHSLVGHFNSVFNKDARDSLSAALINVGSVERKLPTPGVVEEAQNPHDHSYKYHVKVVRGGNAVSIQVCIKAFLYTYDETLAKKDLMMWSR